VEFAKVRPDLEQKIGDPVQIGGIASIRIKMQIMQAGRHDVVG